MFVLLLGWVYPILWHFDEYPIICRRAPFFEGQPKITSDFALSQNYFIYSNQPHKLHFRVLKHVGKTTETLKNTKVIRNVHMLKVNRGCPNGVIFTQNQPFHIYLWQINVYKQISSYLTVSNLGCTSNLEIQISISCSFGRFWLDFWTQEANSGASVLPLRCQISCPFYQVRGLFRSIVPCPWPF